METDHQMYTFTKNSVHSPQTKSFIEYSHVAHEDAPWTDIVMHFGHFLESCGYVSVVDKLEMMFEDAKAQY